MRIFLHLPDKESIFGNVKKTTSNEVNYLLMQANKKK